MSHNSLKKLNNIFSSFRPKSLLEQLIAEAEETNTKEMNFIRNKAKKTLGKDLFDKILSNEDLKDEINTLGFWDMMINDPEYRNDILKNSKIDSQDNKEQTIQGLSFQQAMDLFKSDPEKFKKEIVPFLQNSKNKELMKQFADFVGRNQPKEKESEKNDTPRSSAEGILDDPKFAKSFINFIEKKENQTPGWFEKQKPSEREKLETKHLKGFISELESEDEKKGAQEMPKKEDPKTIKKPGGLQVKKASFTPENKPSAQSQEPKVSKKAPQIWKDKSKDKFKRVTGLLKAAAVGKGRDSGPEGNPANQFLEFLITKYPQLKDRATAFEYARSKKTKGDFYRKAAANVDEFTDLYVGKKLGDYFKQHKKEPEKISEPQSVSAKQSVQNLPLTSQPPEQKSKEEPKKVEKPMSIEKPQIKSTLASVPASDKPKEEPKKVDKKPASKEKKKEEPPKEPEKKAEKEKAAEPEKFSLPPEVQKNVEKQQSASAERQAQKNEPVPAFPEPLSPEEMGLNQAPAGYGNVPSMKPRGISKGISVSPYKQDSPYASKAPSPYADPQMSLKSVLPAKVQAKQAYAAKPTQSKISSDQFSDERPTSPSSLKGVPAKPAPSHVRKLTKKSLAGNLASKLGSKVKSAFGGAKPVPKLSDLAKQAKGYDTDYFKKKEEPKKEPEKKQPELKKDEPLSLKSIAKEVPKKEPKSSKEPSARKPEKWKVGNVISFGKGDESFELKLIGKGEKGKFYFSEPKNPNLLFKYDPDTGLERVSRSDLAKELEPKEN